jgi:hypothetical protein
MGPILQYVLSFDTATLIVIAKLMTRPSHHFRRGATRIVRETIAVRMFEMAANGERGANPLFL